MKNFLKSIVPPALLNLYRTFRIPTPKISPKKFKLWWLKYLESHAHSDDLNQELIDMVDYFIKTKAFTNDSGHWLYLCKSHIQLLVENGIENYKQTIEKKHYWGESSLESRLIKPIINDAITINVDTQMIFKTHDDSTISESIGHNISNIILLNYLVNNKLGEYLEYMEESEFGNPITINYNNKKISFALLNSILEVDVVSKNIDFKERHRFLELGAGSGRTCIAMCKAKKNIKYIICDIPPALYISQQNISREFSEKKIFKFQSFKSFDDVEEDMMSAEIAFISPEQLQLIPDKFIDTCIAIDCLHEMTNETVDEYFEQFNRISHTLFFKAQVKQWANTSRKPLDIDTYPIRDNWEKILHERSTVPNDYFNAIYRM